MTITFLRHNHNYNIAGITVHTRISVTSLPDLLFSEHKSIVEGSVLWLYCEVSSISDTLSVIWNKDGGQLVQDVPHIRLRTSNTSSTILLLAIDNVVSSDAGVYQCTARNGQDLIRGESLTMTGVILSISKMLILLHIYCFSFIFQNTWNVENYISGSPHNWT